MKLRTNRYVLILLVCGLLIGCHKGKEEVEGPVKKEENPRIESRNENMVQKGKGTPEWDLQQIEKAVESSDKDLFMNYQNQDNPLFYKEQQRWMEEAIFKKEQGYKVSVDLFNFSKENDSTGMVSFKVTMNQGNTGESINTVNYQMLKVKDRWVLNDVPFEKISSNNETITVYYFKGQEEAAQKTLKDAIDLVDFYSIKFSWRPEPISIKVYPTQPEISATVPWPGLSGWNEMGESLKITSELSSDIFHYLSHELTHKMVGDLSNDNATIYIQEGIATFFAGSIYREASGGIAYKPELVTDNAVKAIEISRSVKTIEELGQIDYTDPEASMYRDGFLITNYLIQTKGLSTYFNMLNYLSNFEYMDKRSEHKMDILHERTVEALEKVYGPTETISSEVKNYYIK
jgi:hypothetical protein